MPERRLTDRYTSPPQPVENAREAFSRPAEPDGNQPETGGNSENRSSRRGWFAEYAPRCDTCGRFVRPMAPGVSSSQSWSYEMDGSPCLNDPTYRCSPCTDARGVRGTNCVPAEHYAGRNPKEPA